MQVLCDLRPTFLKCNCQTPEKRKGMLQEAHKQIVECLLKRDVVNGQKALMKHFDMIDNIIHKEL